MSETPKTPTSKIVQTYYLSFDNPSIDMVFLVLCEDGSIWVKECNIDSSHRWLPWIEVPYINTLSVPAGVPLPKSKIVRILKFLYKFDPLSTTSQTQPICVVECEDGSVWSARRVEGFFYANSSWAWIRHIEPFDEEKGYE